MKCYLCNEPLEPEDSYQLPPERGTSDDDTSPTRRLCLTCFTKNVTTCCGRIKWTSNPDGGVGDEYECHKCGKI